MISVIIPAYNAERYIKEAIESALSQTYKDIEIIVINDGSTDRTGDIAFQCFQHESQRVLIVHQKNKGASAARNTGIKYAKGEYIAFLDADDVWLPNKLQKQIALLENDKDLALVYSNCYRNTDTLFDIAKPHRGFAFSELILDNFIPTSSVVVRKSILDKVGVFNESFLISQDFDLWLRIAHAHKIDFVDLPLVKYEMDSDGLSKKRIPVLKEVIKIVAKNRAYKQVLRYVFYIVLELIKRKNDRDMERDANNILGGLR